MTTPPPGGAGYAGYSGPHGPRDTHGARTAGGVR